MVEIPAHVLEVAVEHTPTFDKTVIGLLSKDAMDEHKRQCVERMLKTVLPLLLTPAEDDGFPTALDGVWPEELRHAMLVIEDAVGFHAHLHTPKGNAMVTDAFTTLKAYMRKARRALRPSDDKETT